jgi:hypothetical protein
VRFVELVLVVGLAATTSCGQESATNSSQATPEHSTSGIEQEEVSGGDEFDDLVVGEQVGQEAELSPRERRLLLLELHCGASYLPAKVNGEFWELDETRQHLIPETGAAEDVPNGWPLTSPGGLLMGYIALGSDPSEIYYYLDDGTLLAVYIPSEVEEIVQCD